MRIFMYIAIEGKKVPCGCGVVNAIIAHMEQ